LIKLKKITAALLIALLLLSPVTGSLNVAAQEGVPSDAEQALFNRGRVLYDQGRYDQALTTLREFLQTYPNSIITDLTLLWLGRTHIQLGQFAEAERISQRLRAIPDTPFIDIYESELQTARRESSTRTNVAVNIPPRTPSPTPSPTPRLLGEVVMGNVTRPTPTPTPAETNTAAANRNRGGNRTTRPTRRPTPQPTPDQIARTTNANTSRPSAANQMTPSRPPRTNTNTTTAANQSNQIASSDPARNPNVNTIPTPIPTPRPTPVAQSTPSAVIESAPLPSGGGGLNITVRQVPNLTLALRSASNNLAASPGQQVSLPITITNTGNKEDQFRLETDLPAEYQPSFSLAQTGTDTNLPVLVTPELARGASISVQLNIRVPETATDGSQRRFLVRAASQSDYQVMRVSDASLVVIAASLAATSNASQPSVMPNETFTQTITVRNNGSASARNARADFVFDPDFELVSANPAPLAYDRPSRTAIWSLGELGARDSRDITITVRAVPDALAASKTLGRGMIRTASLSLPSNFDGPNVAVGRVTRARIESVSAGLTATPGDTMFVPFVVRNPGNYAESFALRVTAPGAPTATVYADTNGDGQHQENEPAISQTAALEPRGGQAPLLLRVEIPRSTPDRQQYAYNVVAQSVTSNRVASEANTVITVATPRVRVRTEQVTETEIAPGDTFFYRLVLINEGTGLARNLVVTETLPEALQFVSSEPSLNPQDAPGNAQRFVWRVSELAPNDTAVLRIAVRLRPNLQAETNLTTRPTLTFQDSNGNSYQGQ
jgi:uncharacterized repeat protein (TIGR01451 family)